MGGAFIVFAVSDEELSAPRSAVRAIARPVKCGAEHAALISVLRDHRRNVCMMVLNTNQRQSLTCGACREILPREICGMEVCGKHLRLHLEKLLVMCNCHLERREYAALHQIADMLAQKRLGAAREAERILQLRAARKHRPLLCRRQCERRRRKAAASADHQPPPRRHVQDRIIDAMHNLPIVHENRIRNSRKRLLCRRILIDNRLARAVRTRHDPEVIFGEQEQMHRCVWKEHAEICIPRCHALRDTIQCIRAPTEQYDRRGK